MPSKDYTPELLYLKEPLLFYIKALLNINNEGKGK